MTQDNRDHIAACPVCARGKSSHQPLVGLLQPLEIPQCHWLHITVDFLTCTPPSEGHQALLTVVDRFSKTLPKLSSAAETGELLIRYVFHFHRIPRDILSNRGPQFFSQEWRAFCSTLEASANFTAWYHPQANEQAERTNQSLEDGLRCMAACNPSVWSTYLPQVEYAHNSLVSVSTGLSPLIVFLGYQPPLFKVQEDEETVPSVQAHIHVCRRVWRQVHAALLWASQHSQ